VHVPLVIVQRSVALVPAARPVTPLTAEDGVVTETAPLTTLHSPVPGAGTFPASVNELVLHNVWSPPAAETGWISLVSTTSSKLVQDPLVIVQRSVAFVPTGTPVTPLVAKVLVVIVATPAVTVQRPVPVTGTLPAKVNAPLLH
jgi:hypothetical protein